MHRTDRADKVDVVQLMGLWRDRYDGMTKSRFEYATKGHKWVYYILVCPRVAVREGRGTGGTAEGTWSMEEGFPRAKHEGESSEY